MFPDSNEFRPSRGSGHVLTVGQGDTGQLGLGEDVMEKTRPQVKSFTFISNIFDTIGKLCLKCFLIPPEKAYAIYWILPGKLDLKLLLVVTVESPGGCWDRVCCRRGSWWDAHCSARLQWKGLRAPSLPI